MNLDMQTVRPLYKISIVPNDLNQKYTRNEFSSELVSL